MPKDPDDVIEDWVYPSADPVKPYPQMQDRQLLFLKFYMETGNLVLSMKSAGYAGDDEQLRTNGYQLRARLRRTVPALLRANGITVNDVLHAYGDALRASKITRIKVKELVDVTDEDGEPVLDKKGNPKTAVQDVIKTFTDADHPTRLRAAEIGSRMFGLLDRTAPGLNALMGHTHDQNQLAAGLIGLDAESDADVAEQEARDVPDAELRSDIAEIQRKLRLIGFELKPVASPADIAAMPNANAEAADPNNNPSQNRTEKPKP